MKLSTPVRSLALVVVLIIAACSPMTYAKWAEKTGRYAVKTKPIFVELQLQSAVDRIDQIDRDTKILAAALKISDNASILATTVAVINGLETLFDQDTELIKDPVKRDKVQKWLTVAEIAVGIIAESFPEVNSHHSLTQDQKKDLETVKAFNKNRRCRASGPIEFNGRKYGAGQFVPKLACDKFPNQTQYERIKK